jgi:hypothetical protein
MPTERAGSSDVFESSRKHGPFDSRYPTLPKLAAPIWDPDENDEEQLDWSALLARFFPNRRRHDREALASYEAYKNRPMSARRAR